MVLVTVPLSQSIMLAVELFDFKWRMWKGSTSVDQ